MQEELPLPEDVEEMAAADKAEQEWRRAMQLDDSKRQMEDYLPGGKKHSGAMFTGERPSDRRDNH